MSAPTIAVPGSVPRNQTATPASNEITSQQQQQEMVNLADALGQQRGTPAGSPEQDGLEAERVVQNRAALSVSILPWPGASFPVRDPDHFLRRRMVGEQPPLGGT